MTLHIVLGECLDTPPARAVLHLASHALDSGVPCQFYAAGRGAASIAKPIRELAFVEDANDLLLWHLDTEQPQLHLAERFPGIRALLCEASAIHDGKERLRSLTRGFEQVWGVDSASVAALKGLGFPDVALWPVPADHDQWLEAITRTQRLPRTNESASVSVVVCTLNRAAHLESCLLQLRRQRYPRFEVIVVNGPSTDETEAVLARFAGEIKVRRNPIANLCVSRNIGIAAAAGEFVAFLDDDSFAHPDWMCEALVAFDDPLTTAVGGLSYRFRDQTVEFANGLLTETTYPWPIQPHPGSHHQGEGGLWNTVTGNNCLFRRDALLAVGGFDEQIPYTHDESNVVMQMARRGMRVRHRPLAIVHHGSQPSLNRRDEFDLNWKVMVRDSIYCGYRNRPAGASSGPFLWRNLWEHARHRLHDPIDWWLYRKVSFAGFLRIQRQCLHGLLAGAVKALTAKPRPLKPGESAAPFLPWPRKQAPDDRIVVCSDSGGALAEALCAEGYAVSAIGSGASALLDSRRGVLYHSVPPDPDAAPCHALAVSVWRTMQELAVRSGARTLCMVDGEEQGLIVALDPRFLTLVGADAPSLAARVRERETTMSHLVDCVDATLFQSSSHATRWKDPVFDRVYQHLPADGNQQVSSLVKAPPEAGRYRIDVFAGLSEACGEGDPVCTLSLRSADGAPLLSASFAGRHFGRGKWAILSASFDGDGVSGPLRLALTNVGFAALRVQRIELWRW